MVGAHMGLLLPTRVLQTSLGIIVLIIAVIMWRAKERESDDTQPVDPWAAALGMHGIFHDPKSGRDIPWHARHLLSGILTFTVIGFIGGMFGLGAGWANVPALNVLMGLPLKLALGTSTLSISVINTSAAWVYLNQGALLPMIQVPAILGVIAGARIGVHVLRILTPVTARWLVVIVLLIAGLRALLQGLFP